MRILLDTHALLWWLDDPTLLSDDAREAIAEPANEVFVSSAVVWEIAIKRALGKLSAPRDLESAISACKFETMAITVHHAASTESLPAHHRDPFDRMLIAQALTEDCTLISRDAVFRRYGVRLIGA